jgi:hypothetical protein
LPSFHRSIIPSFHHSNFPPVAKSLIPYKNPQSVAPSFQLSNIPFFPSFLICVQSVLICG